MTETTDFLLSLADLALFPATYEQIIESRKRSAVQWSGNMTLEEYLQRDVILDGQEHAADGKFVTWVLAPRSNPTTLDFMCSCETFRRTALVAKRQAGSASSEIQEVIAYGVASVFTPSRNRRKGYARHMMRLLHWVLAPRSALPPTFPKEWGTPPDEKMLQSAGVANAQFSVLYSDIGSEFYRSSGVDAVSRNGWYVTSAKGTSWTFDTEADPSSPPQSDATNPNHNAKHLTQDEATALYDYDADWMRDDLSRPSATGSDAPPATGATRFTFLPHKGVAGFNISRTVQFAPNLQPFLPLSRWGVVILPQSVSTLADGLANFGRRSSEPGVIMGLPFISWTFDTGRKEKTLVVTRLRADERTFPILLEETKAVAREEKVRKIEFWYLHPQLRSMAEAKGWKTADREDHLPSVKWYGDESEDELEWVYNEKYLKSLLHTKAPR